MAFLASAFSLLYPSTPYFISNTLNRTSNQNMCSSVLQFLHLNGLNPSLISLTVICNPVRIFRPQFGSRIVDILDGAPLMEMNLTDYSNKFLIRLTPNFVAFVLSLTQVNINPNVTFGFFNWARKQKKCSHKLECYVSLIDVLSVYYDVGRIKVVFDKFKGSDFLMTVNCCNSLIKSFGNLGMVEELLWVWR